MRNWLRRLAVTAALLALVVGLPSAIAGHTPAPTSVTVAGSLQSELGCPGDWQPDCATTHLTYDAADQVWQGTWNVPAGDWEYKAALNNAWDENYGLHAAPGGANIPLSLGAAKSVKFYYDHRSHWITDNVGSVIATVPGSFQSELGCPGDWQPDCLRSWLEDPDGDGVYTFSTAAIPPGSYEAKVAINESWDLNYGAGGAQNGANIPFTVVPGATVLFSWNAGTHVLTIQVVTGGSAHDDNVEWDGVRHDSRSDVYRTPGGAVQAGTPVKLRLRTFHDDVTDVKLRVYDVNAAGQQLLSMSIAADDVSCYDDTLAGHTCDFWEVTLPNGAANNLWYRFVVTDGSDTDYYGDNTPALDGGGGATTDDVVDNSWALTVYQPGFTAPAWARRAVLYQIFPDRFRNGRKDNDPKTGDVRYDDPVLQLPWGTLPEGFCRNYDSSASCPWRFDTTPPPGSPREQPRGRDYMGGDLKGVDQQLDYLQSLGVTAIYFNPIFDAGSNHSYDTQDYTRVDPYFGALQDWENLVRHARDRGMRVIVDGVFNHMSSDSPFFDRYHHYPPVGACESAASPNRNWFTFRPPAGSEPSPCAPSVPGGNDTYYAGWFGFDSIPVLTKTIPAVQDYFLTGSGAITKLWLGRGASGWRLDVSGDPSFPAGYWESFRQVVKNADPQALTISETWQKDSTLLRMIRGDRLDTTMNYRFRDAVIGLLAPGNFDSKGFADSGRPLKPSEVAARLASIREDYADAAYYAAMNLLDSHDTERSLWTLTPASAETRAEKESNATNLAAGKQRLRLASLVQFTVPGMPTVYYGDEVGVTGDDDPDDRRTMPWPDLGGAQDAALRSHYQALGQLRRSGSELVDGDFRVLLADDAARTLAYARKAGDSAALVVLNVGDGSQTVAVPVAGLVPEGTTLTQAYAVGSATGVGPVAGGKATVTLGARSGVVVRTVGADLTGPAAPSGLAATEAYGKVDLSWSAVGGAAGYNVYRSPLSGGGRVKVNGAPVSGTTFADTGVQNGRTYYYVVRALDEHGNESASSNEVSALPHAVIGWANLQWPPSITHTISAVNRTATIYGQVWIDGLTNQPGQAPGLLAQVGFGPDGSNPDGNAAWAWVDATFNVDVGNNDEFKGSLLPDAVGTYDYAYRYSTTDGRDWVYADLDGSTNGYSAAQAGALTVVSSGDTTAPATPAGLHVVTASPGGIELAWNAVAGDPSLYGYEVRRSGGAGGPYTTLAFVTGTSYTDADVTQGATYHYVVRAVDLSFNRSPNSAEVAATAELRTVTLAFTVTVPATTDGTGRSVYIAGTLNRLDGNLPEWNPGGVVLTRLDATHWRITLTGKETTQIEYKYTLGDWEHVEKDASCGEIANRQLTLSYGASGTQNINDTVSNWRNVAPCGN
jgi:glycosidase/fibronectin type 3 domain-containing protein